MRILIAPDSFKSCLSASHIAANIAAALRESHPHATLDLCPLSDGGEGFLEALLTATHGERKTTRVTGPLPDQTVEAHWGFLGSSNQPTSTPPTASHRPELTAVVELAQASGLPLVPDSLRDPANTTTFGTGQLLLAATNAGATRILLGLGGSATIDAGLGLCQAVGHTILRHDQEPISPNDPLSARDLPNIYLIKRGRGSPLDRVPITVACDVTSPLYGPTGAAHTFGPQKGATPAQCAFFDAQHHALAQRTHTDAQARTPGAGAAGGVGWALLSFFNATLVPGLDVIAQAVNLRDRIAAADLVITGEGTFDTTSLHNKLPVAVSTLCRELRKPCHLLAGRVALDPSPHFTTHQQISPPDMPLAEARQHAPALIRAATTRLFH